jgi:hypothetical protein
LRKANTTSLMRMVLAFAAFLAVAGPAMVMGAPPGTTYSKPLYADISGSATCGSSFSLSVNFSGTSGLTPVSGSSVHFSARLGSINSDGSNYQPPAGGKDLITATYSNSAGTVGSSRVFVTGPACI